MIVWSGWGIVVALIAIAGLVIGVLAGDALGDSLGLAYGPAQAAGISIGGIFAAAGVFLFARWRESGQPRSFIDEASGQRFEVRPSAGSLFFIPSRYWTWILLALTALFAFSMYSSTGPSAGGG